MTKVSTRPPAGATQAPKPSKADTAAMPIENEISNPATVVAAEAALMIHAFIEEFTKLPAISSEAYQLLLIAEEWLDQATSTDDERECLFRAEALVAGALALDRAEFPEETVRQGQLEIVYRLLESAGITDGFQAGYCKDLAHGIRIGKMSAGRAPEPTERSFDVDFGDESRMDIIRRAGGEVADWANLIQDLDVSDNDSTDRLMRLLPRIAVRLDTLGSIVMSGISDEMESTANLAMRFGAGVSQ